MALLSLVTVAVVFGIGALIHFVASKEKSRLPTGVQALPGPKGYPILGSAPNVPDKNNFLKFHEWGENYGRIYQVNLAGQNHVWITRDSVAQDLLGKRAANYSERPHIPSLTHDNRVSGHYLPLMSRNERWTRQRKFGKQIMDKSAKASYYDLPEKESVRLLFDLLTDPSRYNHALESFIARVTSRLAWGTAEPADELKQRARELLYGVSPNGSLTNKLAFLKLLPDFLVPAKAWEHRRFRTESRFFTMLQDEVREKARQPGAAESWTRHFLDNREALGFESDAEGAHAVGMHGIAGALTIAAPMQSFCLALCHFPHLQRVLHDEIDSVLGDRMPTLNDMPNMPVLRAFIRETLRWRPPVPTGIPHESVKDDIYEGYFIPAGSVMHPLEWSIGRDPEVFPDPDTFNPMRWIDPKYPTYQEPLSKYPTITGYSQFGYGRRVCQGMGVVDADLFVGIGAMAWMFKMSADGQVEQSATPTSEVPAVSINGVPNDDVASTSEKDLEALFVSEKSPMSRKRTLLGRKKKPSANLLQTPECNIRRTRTISHKLRIPGQALPGQFPAFFAEDTRPDADPGSPKRIFAQAGTEDMPSVKDAITKDEPHKADPTLEYSSLLIAKPLPFKFNLQIRDRKKAEHVAREWLNLMMDGELVDSRCYWEGGNSGNAEFGWGEVHK
ncbi:hypothetical protein AAFC00_005165 [Neodothiora populina]|uniref:Cytochrome P450 n=1 Tax=Neodothiora populina TaxID=2781224 RepID=A0ABR3PK01_9PEZI